MEDLIILGDGSLIKGILIFPFAISGLMLFIKGVISNIEEIGAKFTFKKDWHISLFAIIIILCYTAFVYSIPRFI